MFGVRGLAKKKVRASGPMVVTTLFVDSLSVDIILVAGFPGWKGR